MYSWQQATLKHEPLKSITLPTTQMTTTSHLQTRATENQLTSYHTDDNKPLEARATEDHHTPYHTDDCNKPPESKDHTLKSTALLTTQISTTSHHPEARATEMNSTTTSQQEVQGKQKSITLPSLKLYSEIPRSQLMWQFWLTLLLFMHFKLELIMQAHWLL